MLIQANFSFNSITLKARMRTSLTGSLADSLKVLLSPYL
jgi:hypothetical protein